MDRKLCQLFSEQLSLLALAIRSNIVQKVRTELSSYSNDILFSMPRVKSIIPWSQDESKRLLLLSRQFSPLEILPHNRLDLLPEPVHRLVEDGTAQLVQHEIEIGVDQYSTHEVLVRLLPDSIKEIPSSFESVGHIAHFNLRDELLPFAETIAAVILEKNPHIQAVVNKTGVIASEFRVFPMQVLATRSELNSQNQQDLMRVSVFEEDCRFEFDYSKVYWNSRLQFEHRRLVQHILKCMSAKSSKTIVVDMFCGVGPFVLPLAKQTAAKKFNCEIYANDLNPDSIYWLKHNADLNKLSNIRISNQDAREFVRSLFPLISVDDVVSSTKEDSHAQTGEHDQWHFIMNLPAAASEFLDVFVELIRNKRLTHAVNIHCYTFCRTDGTEDLQMKIATGLGLLDFWSNETNREHLSIKTVRNVAPNKEMYCVSFVIDPSRVDLTGNDNANDSIGPSESSTKRLRV